MAEIRFPTLSAEGHVPLGARHSPAWQEGPCRAPKAVAHALNGPQHHDVLLPRRPTAGTIGTGSGTFAARRSTGRSGCRSTGTHIAPARLDGSCCSPLELTLTKPLRCLLEGYRHRVAADERFDARLAEAGLVQPAAT